MITGSGTDWRVLKGIQQIINILTGENEADLRAENARLRNRLAEIFLEQAEITNRLNAVRNEVKAARDRL